MDISKIALDKRTILRVLENALLGHPGRTALQDPAQTLSYERAWTEALRISNWYSSVGLGRQEGVLLMLDNHVDNVLCWLGLCLGARVEISINTAYTGMMLAYLIADSGARVLIIEERYLPRIIEIADAIPALTTLVVRTDASDEQVNNNIKLAARRWVVRNFEELRRAEPASPERIDPWDLISISYTSGTTGRSKGVLCPHAHAFGHATMSGLCNTLPGEIRYVVLPQFHAAGRWGGIYNALVREASAYIAPMFSASRYWELATAVGARTSQIIGTMADFLFRQPAKPTDREHSLREIAILPLPADLMGWKARFGVDVATGYGSTEAGGVVTNPNAVSSSVGRAREGYEVRVVDEHDREVANGSVGEAVVRPTTPWTTSVGYLRLPEQSAALWRNGWLHTGDALYRDDEGNFFFVDRLDDAIRRRGENISSTEVELLVNAHPAVAESAAVAVPSEYLEDEIKAVVVLKKGARLTEQELIAYLSKTMPPFMIPRYVQFVGELPKTATSKVKKKELRASGVQGAWDATAASLMAATKTN